MGRSVGDETYWDEMHGRRLVSFMIKVEISPVLRLFIEWLDKRKTYMDEHIWSMSFSLCRLSYFSEDQTAIRYAHAPREDFHAISILERKMDGRSLRMNGSSTWFDRALEMKTVRAMSSRRDQACQAGMVEQG